MMVTEIVKHCKECYFQKKICSSTKGRLRFCPMCSSKLSTYRTKTQDRVGICLYVFIYTDKRVWGTRRWCNQRQHNTTTRYTHIIHPFLLTTVEMNRWMWMMVGGTKHWSCLLVPIQPPTDDAPSSAVNVVVNSLLKPHHPHFVPWQQPLLLVIP
jgi:hypothetical protein